MYYNISKAFVFWAPLFSCRGVDAMAKFQEHLVGKWRVVKEALDKNNNYLRENSD